jgi:hypothetical protein
MTMNGLAEDIKRKLETIQEKIVKAAISSGRNANEVKLVTVSKTKPVEVLRAAAEAGITLFGENYPEETVSKIEALSPLFPGLEWHMIGHLQSRKASLVAEHFTMMHSLDSVKLAERLGRKLNEYHRTLPVLLEMNVSGEDSKGGWPAWNESLWEGLLPEVEKILATDSLLVKGLMTMPPMFDDPQAVRPYFVRIRQLRDWLAKRFPQSQWDELSMGTSLDFIVAVEEGATFVRIGTAILGSRVT